MLRYWKYICIVVAGIVLVALALTSFVKKPAPVVPGKAAALAVNASLPMKTITVGKNNIQVEVASTNAQREQGLSDRTSLAEGHGMLFVFTPPKKVGFWMKDMQFSLDMIFGDAGGVITKIDGNVSPDTYPQTFPSGSPIMYVLEVPAGYATMHGIATGMKIVVQ